MKLLILEILMTNAAVGSSSKLALDEVVLGGGGHSESRRGEREHIAED